MMGNILSAEEQFYSKCFKNLLYIAENLRIIEYFVNFIIKIQKAIDFNIHLCYIVVN